MTASVGPDVPLRAREWHWPPPSRSCWAHCRLNGASRCGHCTQHHRSLARVSVVQSVPTASPLASCTRLSRSTRTLRPPASLLHNALFCEVVTSHCAKAPFVLPTASRPAGLQNRRYVKWPSLVGWLACTVASVRRCAHSPSQWPAASHVVCAPAHPCASPLRGISPARWSARPPPEGAPSARAVCRCSTKRAHTSSTGTTTRVHWPPASSPTPRGL
jgi:hypothetical protein